MKIFDSLSSLDQIRGSPLSPMLQGIVVGMLGHLHYDPADAGYVVLVEESDIDRPLADLCLPYCLCEVPFGAAAAKNREIPRRGRTRSRPGVSGADCKRHPARASSRVTRTRPGR